MTTKFWFSICVIVWLFRTAISPGGCTGSESSFNTVFDRVIISILRAVRPADEGVFTEPVRGRLHPSGLHRYGFRLLFFTLPNVRGLSDRGIVANRIIFVVFAVFVV
ncbi:hypothetical protein [Microcoleus anatoxicus]|uniref:hypothetical protein n=1 Tax=Microcoleus anatoxicus TaxID=2705319 RepID=UPI0030C9D9A7